MAFNVEHELHKRRLGRNVGLGIVLMAFVALVFGLTVVKVVNMGKVEAVPAAEITVPVAKP
ncbi:hypothetical protein ACEN2J_12170 [Pseudorhodobacter sp. W20_MBD10_FR17]|uniref:hypothetical protein n=1 Tax=Pseudorhodobacter sp. W20_MBD10_FR17 TaxID=3240266 RepID=UPI003F976DD1